MKQYESVKMEKETVDKVRQHVSNTRQSISGFFSIAAEYELNGGLLGKIREDKELYYAYQANIAMAVKDEFSRWKKRKKSISNADMHEIANTAAKYFLDLLVKR